MKDDTISRAAAIDAICEDGTQRERQGQYSMTMVDRKYRDIEILEALPSAQPVNIAKLQPNCNQVASDCISRQAAIETVRKAQSIGQAHRMLVQLPSAQPECEDAVSRKAVAGIYTALWEIIGTIMDRDEWDDVCHTTANELPSVTPKQPGWIPCGERLPQPNEYENGVRKYYLVQNEYGDMMVCSWRGRHWMQMYRNTNVKDKVVAWMPLPEPWEGGQE